MSTHIFKSCLPDSITGALYWVLDMAAIKIRRSREKFTVCKVVSKVLSVQKALASQGWSSRPCGKRTTKRSCGVDITEVDAVLLELKLGLKYDELVVPVTLRARDLEIKGDTMEHSKFCKRVTSAQGWLAIATPKKNSNKEKYTTSIAKVCCSNVF